MCGVVGQEKLTFKEQSRLQGKARRALLEGNLPGAPNYNIWTGMQVFVITSDQPEKYQSFTFGLSPAWSEKRMYLFNARAEGKENKENEEGYCGEAGIFKMPSFRSSIQSKRCLIPVDYFIEGTIEKRLAEPYMIRRQDREPFLLAGIWDEWVDKTSGEVAKGCSIITTAAPAFMRKLPHHRAPLVLEGEQMAIWMEDEVSREKLEPILRPFRFDSYESVRVAPDIRKRKNQPPVPVLNSPETQQRLFD